MRPKLTDTRRINTVCMLYDRADPRLPLELLEITHSHSLCQLLSAPRFSFEALCSWLTVLSSLSAWLVALWLCTWHCGQCCLQLSCCSCWRIERTGATLNMFLFPEHCFIRVLCASLLLSIPTRSTRVNINCNCLLYSMYVWVLANSRRRCHSLNSAMRWHCVSTISVASHSNIHTTFTYSFNSYIIFELFIISSASAVAQNVCIMYVSAGEITRSGGLSCNVRSSNHISCIMTRF